MRVVCEYVATLGMIDVAYIPPHAARADYTDLWGEDETYFLSRYDGLHYLRLMARCVLSSSLNAKAATTKAICTQ